MNMRWQGCCENRVAWAVLPPLCWTNFFHFGIGQSGSIIPSVPTESLPWRLTVRENWFRFFPHLYQAYIQFVFSSLLEAFACADPVFLFFPHFGIRRAFVVTEQPISVRRSRRKGQEEISRGKVSGEGILIYFIDLRCIKFPANSFDDQDTNASNGQEWNDLDLNHEKKKKKNLC